MFDSLIREITTRFGLGDQGRSLVQMVLAYITNPATGGLSGMLERLRSSGLEGMVQSWLGNTTTPQVPSNSQVESMFGAGAGYQSTIRAYLALEADLDTVAAFTVYEQGETPGLGARVAEDGWQAQWAGKRIFDDGDFAISVVRGNASGPNEVDGISGASVTSYAISDMLEFWMGEHGFGPFLDRLKKGEIE